MRILISNPDTIGDVVLRQPMFGALAQAGHELMLVVRPMLAPVMGLVAPGARVEVCNLPLYDPRLGVGAPELDPIAECAAGFDPDLYIVAPYQWTALEERLAGSLPRARTIAMNGRRYGDPQYGPAPRSLMEPEVVVEVAPDLPEVKKNERVAGAALGRAVSLPDPAIAPREAHRQLAGAALERLGLAPGGYWAACVGEAAHTSVRNWGHAQWGELLGRWASESGERFLFIGLDSESAAVASVRDTMGEAGAATAEWRGGEGGDLETLVGLLEASRGYIGRDTGPMHLAAALGKPVAAVFGGGTWPRFVPAGRRSVVVTVGVPCAGCEWRCHLRESYCIKRVPVDEVWRAVQDVRSGEPVEQRARVLAPDPALLARIGREGAEAARVRLVQASVARRELIEERKGMSQNGVADSAVEAVFGAEPKPGAFRESRREESTTQIAQLQARLNEQARARGEQQALIESLREQLGEAKARARDLENRLERRVADLMTATAESAMVREKHASLERSLAAAKREAEQAHQQGDALRDSLRRAQADLEEARAGLQAARQEAQAKGVEAAKASQAREHAAKVLQAQLAEVKQEAGALAAERDRRRTELDGLRAAHEEAVRRLNGGEGQGARLAAAQKSLGQARAEMHDLRVKLKKFETDRTALANLSRQQEQKISQLHGRLNDLLASRWRRYGQKFGLAMTLPWEAEMRNGRA